MMMLASPSSRSEEHTSELQSQSNLVCRLLLEKKKPSTPRGVGRSCWSAPRLTLPRLPRPLSCFFLILPTPPTSTLFPYTTLFRSVEMLVLPDRHNLLHALDGITARRERVGPVRRRGDDDDAGFAQLEIGRAHV